MAVGFVNEGVSHMVSYSPVRRRCAVCSVAGGKLHSADGFRKTVGLWAPFVAAAVTAAAVCAAEMYINPPVALADPTTASKKVGAGAASTGYSGSKKTVTRGVDLSEGDFAGQNLKGVSFQQSLLRGADFSGADLSSASFFDADLTDCNMEGANLRLANLELSNLRGANLKNAVLEGAYVVGATKINGVKIEGADFTEVGFRKDQQKYLCSIASGTNPVTKVDTKDSLMCAE